MMLLRFVLFGLMYNLSMTVNLRKTLGFWLSFYLFSNYSQRSKLTGQYRFRSY